MKNGKPRWRTAKATDRVMQEDRGSIYGPAKAQFSQLTWSGIIGWGPRLSRGGDVTVIWNVWPFK